MINVTTFTSTITVKDSELEAVAKSYNLDLSEIENADPPLSEELKLTHLRLALNEHYLERQKQLTSPYVEMLANQANISTRAFLMSKVNEAVSTTFGTQVIPES